MKNKIYLFAAILLAAFVLPALVAAQQPTTQERVAAFKTVAGTE